ncbi:unnamed protein product [Arctia plantaginis]|uniref:Uncharacterized protein n=1 Tax=Arctia plantaginis TaxID=874455 RepID=A0A8S0ZBV5_ARCPL|nr:unnamed protein product [Arctia plantaginis]
MLTSPRWVESRESSSDRSRFSRTVWPPRTLPNARSQLKVNSYLKCMRMRAGVLWSAVALALLAITSALRTTQVSKISFNDK